VAKRVFSALRCGTFTEVDLRATDVLRLGFGGAGAPGVPTRAEGSGQTHVGAR
jgi:hypothetical protein